MFLPGLLQEHQESILGNTMQSVIALLNNLVAYKDSNMQLLYEQGKLGIEPWKSNPRSSAPRAAGPAANDQLLD